MLAGKSQAGIWALGNIQEENGFVLGLRRSPTPPAWGASVGPLCPVALGWVLVNAAPGNPAPIPALFGMPVWPVLP